MNKGQENHRDHAEDQPHLLRTAKGPFPDLYLPARNPYRSVKPAQRDAIQGCWHAEGKEGETGASTCGSSCTTRPLSATRSSHTTPPKPTKVVAGESPSKSVLLQAQRQARQIAKKKQAEARSMLQEAVAAYAVAGRIFDSKMKRIEGEMPTARSPPNLSARTRPCPGSIRQRMTSWRPGTHTWEPYCCQRKQISKFWRHRRPQKMQRSRDSGGSCGLRGAHGGRDVGGALRGSGLVSEHDLECFGYV